MDINKQGCEENMAVVVRNAVKSYGSKEPRVLDELNMNVPRGCIYGLLGASGTGKTTLLSAVVGLLKLDSGQISVLGVTPGDKVRGVPGTLIGYMPQDISLVPSITIRNTFFFFGWVYGMTSEEIVERLEFLTDLLQLPADSCCVMNLSGGQMRRLSLAVAVLHSPKVLILDEPTVGQDPTLRHSIWEYMVEMSEKQNLTIIITTHYIEEARAAHKVGLLRKGKLLAEGSPSDMLEKFNCSSLEEVSLLLSQKQRDGMKNTRALQDNHPEVAGPSCIPDENVVTTDEPDKANETVSAKDETYTTKSTFASRMKAVLYISWLKFSTNYLGLFLTFGFPILQFAIFVISIGGDPTYLPIGVVNYEMGNCQTLPGGWANHSNVQLSHDICQFTGLSCLYIDKINTDRVRIYYYDTLEQGKEATKQGKTLGTLYFHNNFTLAFQTRQESRQQSSTATVEMSEIKVWMDMADYLLALSLQQHFVDNFLLLQEDISDKCNYTKKYISIPMEMKDPVYGLKDKNYIVSMTPGYIITLIMFLTTAYSSTVIITEKAEGVWGRNITAGLSSAEMLAAHLCAHLVVMVIMVIENIIIVFSVFSNYIIGSVTLMVALLLAQATCGVGLGILISAVSTTLYESTFATMAIMNPFTVVCGVMWPIEGIPYTIRVICYYFPGLSTTQAFFNILYKGWGITHPEVYPGFLIPLVWTFIFLGISAFSIKRYGMR